MSSSGSDGVGEKNRSVGQLIDHWAAQTPQDIFLINPETGSTVSYLALQKACRSFASFLQKSGVVPGDRVAYAMANGVHCAQAILGTLYAGAVTTAVNLVSGQNTIAHVIEHSGAKLVLVDQQSRPFLESAVAGSEASTKIIDIQSKMFAEPELLDAHSDWLSDGLLMYTSGTTGVPKGVVHTHKSILAGGQNAVLAHDLNRDDRGLCVLPLYHINAFCVSLMGALVSGGSLVMPGRFSVSQFWRQSYDHACTWFSIVPTQVSYLLHDEAPDFQKGKLRFGRSASAPLSPEVQQSFEDRFQIPIIETMGLTETAAQILSNPISGRRKIGSPGIPFGNEVIIANPNQDECRRGEEGEVLVRGDNVMRHYRNNESVTDESLTPSGWLRTGDLGRMDEDGFVFITGRIKELIIKGGENIAPREIDEALYCHPDVIEAAAFARQSERYGQTVEAGVKIKDGSGLTEDDLVNLCREKVGAFKAPDQVHIFPELPKGPSGKIQRLKLADMAS